MLSARKEREHLQIVIVKLGSVVFMYADNAVFWLALTSEAFYLRLTIQTISKYNILDNMGKYGLKA